jgi:hypothetical protein
VMIVLFIMSGEQEQAVELQLSIQVQTFLYRVY